MDAEDQELQKERTEKGFKMPPLPMCSQPRYWTPCLAQREYCETTVASSL